MRKDRKDEVSLDNCLKCTDCNTACPVVTAHPAYPGPKRLGPELERMRREGIECDTEWVEYCLGCHRCDLACPNQVNVSELIARAKAAHKKTPVRRLRDFWLARPGLLGKLNTIVPEVTNFSLGLKPVRKLMSMFMKITPERKFPAYTKPDLRTPNVVAMNKGERVVFFPGCFIQYNQPELGRRVLELLELNGFQPEVASTGCCGVPSLANGNSEEAYKRATANVNSMMEAVNSGARIVTACSSCGHMLKTGFAHLLEDDPDLATKAAKIAANTYDLAELLVAQQDAGKFNTRFAPATATLKLAYHAPCHQKSQGIGRPWYHLLRQVPGVEIEDLNAGCCGMSGTFGFKEEKYPVSMEVGGELFAAISATAPQAVVTECATCQMQIEHGTGFKAVHPAIVLLNAYATDAKQYSFTADTSGKPKDDNMPSCA
ncbi:MAG: anaerobic glycerol-3-phosphate dehydrogenase subunit C [Acidobacteria bacterium]|nr:MAG: anaerobic glycerol-3-phosphate dehydrogenase subunit C [Acidobacteriota bacterium]